MPLLILVTRERPERLVGVARLMPSNFHLHLCIELDHAPSINKSNEELHSFLIYNHRIPF